MGRRQGIDRPRVLPSDRGGGYRPGTGRRLSRRQAPQTARLLRRGRQVQSQRDTGRRGVPGHLAVHTLRRRARAEPAELLARGAAGAGPAAARALRRSLTREWATSGERLLRRPDGGGAGQRRAGDDRYQHRRLGSTDRLTIAAQRVVYVYGW